MVVNRNKFLYILTAFTVLVITASFALHIYMDVFNFTAYAIVSIVTILYCIFIILVWFNTLKKAINEEELAQQKFYNESLRNTLFDLRRIKHDWNNNLTVIFSMLKMNKIDELKQYVSEMIAHNTDHGSSTEIYSIKNAGLFGIISSKMNLASEKGIKVELSVIGEIENIPGVKISELCEIVGIFLDNAIEEAVKATKKVDILVRKSQKGTEISISNGCLDTPDIKAIYKEGYSTKGENRGMGLAIARQIVDKYDNILLTTSVDDNVFTQTLEILAEKGS
ncbi:MAG: sensor histidine kinase [Acetivibrionales bacterium]